VSTPHGVGHTTYSNAVRTDFLSVRGASSAVPSDVDLQQYEGAIEKKKRRYLSTRISSNCYCFHSTPVTMGTGVRYHIDNVSEYHEMVIDHDEDVGVGMNMNRRYEYEMSFVVWL
jgi:hypothetical protein